ncbi:MAG: SpoIIE family protein phosphatase, partial [Bacteroidetes bacterium]|nr:SpoIIE family protein phosphatase [Bacteroidota bacterium]
NDEKGFFLDYDYSDHLGGSINNIRYNSHAIVENYLKQIKRADDAFAEVVIEGNQLDSWKDFRRRGGQPDDPKLDDIQALYYYLYSIGVGDIGISTFKPIDESQIKILKRFRNVFDLAYRTYTDITKAETQARESQIQLALERVRARTMAMQQSDELADTASVLFKQFVTLGLLPKRCSIGIIDRDTHRAKMWVTSTDGKVLPGVDLVPLTEEEHLIELYKTWQNKKAIYSFSVKGEDRLKWTRYITEKVKMNLPEYQPDTIDTEQILNEPAFLNSFIFSHGFIMLHTVESLRENDLPVLMGFASVFEQTYTRFLDLQNAEAQAREAKIEVALERVRSRTMAMYDSNELLEAVAVFFQQFKSLGLLPSEARTYFCHINTDDHTAKVWMTHTDGKVMQGSHITPLNKSPSMLKYYEAWKSKEPLNIRNYSGEALADYMQFLSTLPHVAKDEGYQNIFKDPPEKIVMTDANFLQGNIGVMTFEPLSQEALDTLVRFAKVFELTYTRFLDLQKAEAQTREAQIEAALERVRSKTMAMHNSHDVGVTVVTLFDEVLRLGIDKSIRCGIGILEGTEKMETWSATSYSNGEVDLKMGMLDMTIHPMLIGLKKAWKSGETGYSYQYTGNDVIRYYNALNNEPEYPFHVELDTLPEKEFHNSFFFSEGILFAFTSNPISEEAAKILNKFASVFGQTYRRYLDLQKAEAQAREAQIEAALERVRARTMAMQKSDDLSFAVATIFDELDKLDLGMLRCGIGILNKEKRSADVWTTTISGNGKTVQVSGDESMDIHPVLQGAFDAWINQKDFSYILEGEDLNKYYKALLGGNLKLPTSQSKVSKTKGSKQYYYVTSFQAGGLFAFRETPFSDESKIVMKRFADVFTFTYTRFNDLMQAEAQNKIIQAENERKTKELEEARQLQIALLPKELPNLPNLDIAVYMQTATEVGGDYYDFHTWEDGALTAVIGDATGHGMKAGTMVTITKSLFDSLASRENILETFDIISKVIKGMKIRQLSMCLMMLKIKDDKLFLSSAAMSPVLIYQKKNQAVEEILVKGMPLGAMHNFPYAVRENHLDKGDTILLMSDGLPELMNDNNEMYGYDRTKTEFHNVGEKEPEEIVDHLKNSASQWVNGKEPDDDVTFVVIMVK